MSRDSHLVIAIWTTLCVIAIILWILTVDLEEAILYDYYFSFFQFFTSLVAAFFCFRTARVLEAGDTTRSAWNFLSVGLLCWSAGALLEGLYPVLHQGEDSPFPWYADIGFLLITPFVIIALSTFRRGLNIKIPPWGWIAAIILFLGAFGLAFQLNFEAFEGLSSIAITVTMAYIIFDSLLLAMMVSVASTLAGGIISRPWQTALAGWFIFYLGDVSYTYLRNVDRADIGGVWLDLSWPIAFGLIALSATMARAIYQGIE